MTEQSQIHPRKRIVLVTGPSGAGRSTAIRTLEDLGFEAIDNIPLSLLPRLLDGPPLGNDVVLGLDVRNRDFSVNALIETIDHLSGLPNLRPEVLYLDCRQDVLLRRFSETRRRHPMAPAESPDQGIQRECDLLVPIMARADILIDSSEMTPHDMKAEVERLFSAKTAGHLAISVNSFSYKRGLPRGMDMVFDCRFLRNPYWDASLRKLDGRSGAVAEYVAQDDRFDGFFQRVLDLTEMLLPAYRDEGKAHFAIGFGCTGGQHRSVAMTEKLSKALAVRGWQVSTRHREIERKANAAPHASDPSTGSAEPKEGTA